MKPIVLVRRGRMNPTECSDEASCDPFHYHGLTLIPVWISNHTLSKLWDEIIYPFPNFNSATVDVYEWASNFILHFLMDVITYPGWN